jgi:hypothetical protein
LREWTAEELLRTEFPDPKWVVPDYLVEGGAACVGRPKIGKTCAIFQIASAVAVGGMALGVRVEQGDVLYLALEDTPRRLKSRLQDQLGGEPVPTGLSFFTEWPRWHEGGEARMTRWLEHHPKARLVVIDTLAKVRPPMRRDVDLYEQAYAMGTALKRLGDRFGVSVVAIYHDRKLEAEDWLDMVSGSIGFVAALDTIWRISRKRGQRDAKLQITGRDVDDRELMLRFDPTRKLWSLLGDVTDLRDAAGAPRKTDALLWLRSELAAQNGIMATRVIHAKAALNDPPYSKETLWDAKIAGDIVSFKIKKAWYWALPEEYAKQGGSRGTQLGLM